MIFRHTFNSLRTLLNTICIIRVNSLSRLFFSSHSLAGLVMTPAGHGHDDSLPTSILLSHINSLPRKSPTKIIQQNKRHAHIRMQIGSEGNILFLRLSFDDFRSEGFHGIGCPCSVGAIQSIARLHLRLIWQSFFRSWVANTQLHHRDRD